MSEAAEIYRGCAEQARLAAQATAHPDHRIIFEQLAQSYEAKANGMRGQTRRLEDPTIPSRVDGL